MNDVTRIMNALAQGDPRAAGQLLPLVYDELRRLAAAQMTQEKPGQTLDATALVHEAYLRLVANPVASTPVDGQPHTQPPAPEFANCRHFIAAAAEAMRRILVENARRKNSLKRGGALQRVPFGDVAAPDADEQLLALDQALTQLAADDPLAARVVELHHFAGLPHEKVADTLGITIYQTRQKWTFARAWLKTAMTNS
jgi:RNA polymerase sigma factor (TIGR02999 family)